MIASGLFFMLLFSCAWELEPKFDYMLGIPSKDFVVGEGHTKGFLLWEKVIHDDLCATQQQNRATAHKKLH